MMWKVRPACRTELRTMRLVKNEARFHGLLDDIDDENGY